jgi:hypothetical protein
MDNGGETLTQKGFSQRYNRYFEQNEILQNAVRRGESYSKGKVYLIGSAVYGFLAGMKGNPKDIDLLLEKPLTGENLKHLDNLEFKFTNFATPYLEEEGMRIDLNYMASLMPNIANPTIDDFFNGVNIYNIQNIAYIPYKGIVGNDGMDAINGRVLRFHNFERAKVIAEQKIKGKKSVLVEEMLMHMLMEKASKLGFDFEFPKEIF